MNAEFLSVFIDETKEHLEMWSNGLLELEKEYSLERIQEIFRAAHTIKGMAATMGFERMGNVTHAAENLLDEIRNERVSVTSDVIDHLLQAVDTLSELLQSIEDGGQESDIDVGELFHNLEAHVHPQGEAEKLAEPEKVTTEVQFDDYPADTQERITQIIENGYRVYDAKILFTDQCLMPFARWYQIRNAIGEENLIYQMPDDDVLGQDDFDRHLRFVFMSSQDAENIMEYIIGTEVKLEELHELQSEHEEVSVGPLLPEADHITNNQIITAIIDEVMNKKHNVYEVGIRLGANTLMKSARALIVFRAIGGEDQLLYTNPGMLDIQNENFGTDIQFIMWTNEPVEAINAALNGVSDIEVIEIRQWKSVDDNVQRGENEVTPKQAKIKERKKTSKTVRVDTEKLESLMTLFSELVIDKTRFEKINEEISHEGLSSTVAHMSRVANELQEIIMQMRVIPLETIFDRFPRMVRDTAKKLGKDIEFVISGKETELDRTVIEEIGDPIMHLLRNSLDHGIESIEKRIAAGKSKVGKIELKAYASGNSVYIEVADDGGGINTKKVLAKAVSNGLVAPDAQLSESEIHQLLFASGFSTADEVTDLSGRGVGLDVVKGTVESLSGRIQVISSEGVGTRFVIQLPMTLAIMQALEVIVAGDPYFVPVNNVQEIQRGLSIKLLDDREFVLWRDSPIPVVRMRTVFHKPESTEPPVYLIVLNGSKHQAVIVDDVLGQKEIVLKPLDSKFRSIRFLSGATILGDGLVALILDLNSLF